jgi:hypothetical protein
MFVPVAKERLMLTSLRQILPTILPALVIGSGYFAVLGHRHDYLGHFSAGFGATLAALALAFKEVPDQQFQERVPARVLMFSLACIAAGAFAEATVFNIAKFDEVDFCNQSLGAILAALGFLANSGERKPDATFFRSEFYAGIIALLVGCYFAMF